MAASWPELCNGPRKSSVWHFGKNLWPLLCILLSMDAAQSWLCNGPRKIHVCHFDKNNGLPMDVAWPGLQNRPRDSSVWNFSKKLWPLLLILLLMGAAWPGICDGPRKSSVWHFGKKLWRFFHFLIANGFSSVSALHRAKNGLRVALWQKFVATFSCFDCRWAQLNLGFATAQE